MSTNKIFSTRSAFKTFSKTGCDELAVEFSREVVLAGSEVGEDDVAGYEVVDGWTEGEEGVYAGWTVLMETEFMEVGIVGEATEAMGRLS
jgi:hypothetical protein